MDLPPISKTTLFVFSSLPLSLSLSRFIPSTYSSSFRFLIFQETCFGVLRRELEHSETEILEVKSISILLFCISIEFFYILIVRLNVIINEPIHMF
jgi:hypothetical protein